MPMGGNFRGIRFISNRMRVHAPSEKGTEKNVERGRVRIEGRIPVLDRGRKESICSLRAAWGCWDDESRNPGVAYERDAW